MGARDCGPVASASLDHGKCNGSFLRELDESLQEDASRNNAEIRHPPPLQIEQAIKNSLFSNYPNFTHVPVTNASAYIDLIQPEYRRLFAPEQTTIPEHTNYTVPIHPLKSSLYSPKKTQNIFPSHSLAPYRQKPSPQTSPAHHRAIRINGPLEDHDIITSLPHLPQQDPLRTRTSTMPSMVSAISYQGLGAIHIHPSTELHTMQSISHLNATLQTMTSFGKPWTTRPESHRSTSSTSSYIPRPTHTLPSPPAAPPPPPTTTLNWTEPTEWLEPTYHTPPAPHEWIEDFLNRRDAADRAMHLRQQKNSRGFLTRSKSLQKLKVRLSKNKLLVVEEDTQMERQDHAEVNLRRNISMSLRRSFSLRAVPVRPGQGKLTKRTPERGVQRCEGRGRGRSMTPVLGGVVERSNSVKELAVRMKEGFVCLGRKASFRKGI